MWVSALAIGKIEVSLIEMGIPIEKYKFIKEI